MEGFTLQEFQELIKHIAVLNDDFTKMSVSLAILQERVEWLVRFFWIVATASIGSLITNIWQLLKWKDKK